MRTAQEKKNEMKLVCGLNQMHQGTLSEWLTIVFNK